MSSKLATIVSDFTTNLSVAIAVAGTTATLQSATDDDGVALPTGTYFFTIDGANSSKEHIVCTLTGTALTNIYSVSRQGVETSGAVRAHRIGATVSITDFGHIKFMNDLLAGTTTFNSSVPLGYDGTTSITTANQFATKAYVDGVAFTVGVLASTTVAGYVQEATLAQTLARTVTGSTGARLFVSPGTLTTVLTYDYVVATGSADAYVLTPTPAITAYADGQRFNFKVVATNLTTTPTANVSALGVKTIVKRGGSALAAGDLLIDQIVEVEYDGTNMQLMSPVANAPALASQLVDIQTFTSNGTWTKPTGAKVTEVFMWGGGGGGGSGRKDSGDLNGRGGGGGGGGGAYSYKRFVASGLGSTETLTVGLGGSGGASQTTDTTNGNPGTAGGDSSFGTTVYFKALGGALGAAGTASGGAGGATGAASLGDIVFAGTGAGTGGDDSVGTAGTDSATLLGGRGGGGGGSHTSAGGAGGAYITYNVRAGGTAGTASGGAGGAGVSGTSQFMGGTAGGGGGGNNSGAGGAGGAGAQYGGGGGGGGGSSGNSGAGGAGGAGVVIIVSYF